jgi:hypothetical protein
METASPLAERSMGPLLQVAATASATQTGGALNVAATFLLSEEGRKASLLAGGDGRAVQELNIRVPATRLHLVSVDRQGVARLKLRPRFEVDGHKRIVRIDSVPTYDAPPTLDDLFRAAAHNFELERAYFAERSAARAKRRDAEYDYREQTAAAFLADQTQRAVVHPPPTPKRCCVQTERGRAFFDVATDVGSAQKVPPEAHRRFRLDLRAKQERIRQERAAQLAIHGERKRFIAEWIAMYGTSEQQVRHAAGVLPIEEVIEAMADEAFTILGDRAQYVRDGAERLQAHLRCIPTYRDVAVSHADLVVTSRHADKATKEQWAFVQELRALKPDASVILRMHRLAWQQDPSAPDLVLYGALVTCKAGPFTVRREYLAPDAASSGARGIDGDGQN